MAMNDDDHVCYCFHVSRRKIVNFCRSKRPAYPSQISECLSAGTGCGWCIPLLKKIHRDTCGTGNQPWWRDAEGPPADATSAADYASAEEYAAAREAYISRKKAKPPVERG